jgi:hypothetical protein
MTEKEINEVDGALWGLTFNGDMVECETTVYKFADKRTPINEDLGSYKYHVLTFKPMEAANTIEFMKAHIGDVRRFIDNHAKSGYNGLMVKDGCVPKKTVKDLIRVTSKNFNIPEKNIRPILAQV